MPLTLICRTATVFHADGGIDEEGFRRHLQRLIEHGHGLYLASGGSGEGHALSHAELRRIYAAGVACGRGKVPVYANPPEQHTAQLTLEHSLLAIEEFERFYRADIAKWQDIVRKAGISPVD